MQKQNHFLLVKNKNFKSASRVQLWPQVKNEPGMVSQLQEEHQEKGLQDV